MRETISLLKKQADKVFSEYIRRRDADWKDENFCFTCGVKKHWKQLQCGHYESRGNNNTRFDERNSQPQCVKCNVFHYGEKTIFALRLMEKYGKGILDTLRKKAQKTKQFTPKELKAIIKKYQWLSP